MVRWRLTCSLLIAGSAVLLLSACSDSEQGRENDPTAVSFATQAAEGRPSNKAAQAWERPFRFLSQRVPEFGGFYFDASGQLVILLTSQTARGAAFDAARGLLSGRRVAAGRPDPMSLPFVVELADFTFTELDNARNLLFNHVLDYDGATTLDLDERRNRVVIGVEGPQGIAEMRSLVDELGIPDDVVLIEERAPVEVTVAVSDDPPLCNGINPLTGTICEPALPVTGGTSTFFHFAESSEAITACTHGFAALVDGELFMIGNSHCSLATYAWDGPTWNTVYESFNDSNPVGFEQYDAVGAINPVTGTQERYSDANLQKITTGILKGEIARPMNRSTTGSVNDSHFVIDTNDPVFFIQDLRQKAFLGEAVDKVGLATGWQSGFVDETCSNRKGTDGFWRLCSQRYTAAVNRGDSGSPAFIFDGSSSVIVVGINWGDDNSEHVKTWMSPIEGIEADYDATLTWTGLQ